MTTDFTYNNSTITTKGGIKPTTSDTPADIRTRVETEADIANIPLPYLGMIIFIKDVAKYVKVTGLKSKKVGLSTLENAAVDTYEALIPEIVGEQGPKGDKGDPGTDGQTPNIAIGTVTTLESGINATAEITGATPNLTLNLGIPKGEKGDQGPQGPAGIQGPQGIQGEAGPAGVDGLTTAISVNGNTYEHVNGTITLPDYPSVNGFATLDYVNEMTGGKKQVYLTQAEYDILTDEQKNDDTIIYNIIDTVDTVSAENVTFNDGQTFQTKLDSGTLKGDKGDIGEQGPQGIQGPKGEKGDIGPQGPAGADAATPNFTFAVNMIASNETAHVTTTGTYPNLVITFNIPQSTGNSGGEGTA